MYDSATNVTTTTVITAALPVGTDERWALQVYHTSINMQT